MYHVFSAACTPFFPGFSFCYCESYKVFLACFAIGLIADFAEFVDIVVISLNVIVPLMPFFGYFPLCPA
jgi:hypothetical protein